jgi:hypothetical protein
MTITENLRWHDAQTSKPDADLTVMVWAVDEGGSQDWYAAWWSGEAWHACAHGAEVAETVTHWAEPAGPLQPIGATR